MATRRIPTSPPLLSPHTPYLAPPAFFPCHLHLLSALPQILRSSDMGTGTVPVHCQGAWEGLLWRSWQNLPAACAQAGHSLSFPLLPSPSLDLPAPAPGLFLAWLRGPCSVCSVAVGFRVVCPPLPPQHTQRGLLAEALPISWFLTPGSWA